MRKQVVCGIYTPKASILQYSYQLPAAGVIGAIAVVTLNDLPIVQRPKEDALMREPYNREKEHEVIGMYPAIRGMELGGNPDGGIAFIPETPRFYRPIPVYENYKRMLLEEKTPYWIPQSGWFLCDVNEFRPRQHPDNMANHQAIDGGDFVDYRAQGDLYYGWFHLPLEWEAASMGATVRPGNPMLTDMNDWKNVLTMPDLDSINWEEMKELNKDYLASDKANQLGIQFGLWERLMNLMGVDNAAIALLDEDQEDAIHEFLDQLSDIYVDYISRVSQIGRIDSVMFHDDWGTHNGPFFSLETCRNIFVPPMKKIVDFCHSRGIVFEHHCCGNAMKLVPAMVECGTDYWFPQAAINDLDQLIQDYKDAHITFSVSNPLLPKGSTEEEIRQLAAQWVNKYKDARILLAQDIALESNPNHDSSLYPIFVDGVYEASRLAYQNVCDEIL